MTDTDFEELLVRARQSEDNAIEALLRHVEARLRRYVESRLGPHLRSKLRDSDVLQNAYIELLRSLPSFEGRTESAFVAWVTAIIENDIRRQRRWFGAQKRAAPESTTSRNALARALLEDPATPSTTVSNIEEKALLARAMERLPEHYREILQLVVLEGLSHEDAALRMERNPKASRMLLLRARSALALEIERLESPGSAD